MMTSNELCTRIFYGTTEIAVALLVFILSSWFLQSKQLIIYQIDEPMVIDVTNEFMDVRWHNKRLVDCPTVGTPSFLTPLAAETLSIRPVMASLEEQTFVRRYTFPEHLLELHHKLANKDVNYSAELRIEIVATCNPIWTTTQLIRVPFIMSIARS